MKSMSDRKMKMSAGGPDSDGFFPSEAQHKKMARPGEMKGFMYPDTEEAIFSDQNSFVKGINAAEPKDGFRH